MTDSTTAAPPKPREMPGWLFGFFMGIGLTCAVVLVGLIIDLARR